MDGQRAFEYLSKMTEDERSAVRMVWFEGRDMLDNLQERDEELFRRKCDFFMGLTNREQGDVVENAIYPGGDFSSEMESFLDRVNSEFELEIERLMREDGQDGSNNKQQQGENKQ